MRGWGPLALSWLLYLSFAFTVASLFPLVGTVRADLGLSYAQLGVVLGTWQLVYLVAALPIGFLLDRWSPQYVLFAGALLIAASQLGRSLSDGFAGLLGSAVLLGLGGPVVSVGLPKVVAEAYTGQRRALASGVYMTGAHVGHMLALGLTVVLTDALDGAWRTTLQLYCGVVTAAALTWLALARDVRREGPPPDAGLRGVVGEMRRLLGVPALRLVVVVGFSGFLASHGYRSWLPEMLVAKGIAPATAGLLAAAPALAGMVGSVVLVRHAARHDRRATVVGLLCVVSTAIVVASLATGPLLVAAVALEGFCAAALVPLMMNTLMELPEVGPAAMGAAAGLYFSVGEIGGFSGPAAVGALAGATGSFVPGMLALAAVMVLMVFPASRLRLPAGRMPGRLTGHPQVMSADDKAANKFDEMAGKAKEATGRATDNKDLEAEGRADQSKSNLKQAGEKVKDAFKK